MSIEIALHDGVTAYRPGEEIRGQISWNLEKEPKSIDISLLWYTSGKGTQDVGTVHSETVQTTHRSGDHAFEFTLPEKPCSFSGKLITLAWAVEAVVRPGKDVARAEFTLSPTGEEIRI